MYVAYPVHDGPLALSQTPGGKDRMCGYVRMYMGWGGGNLGHHLTLDSMLCKPLPLFCPPLPQTEL